jgi:hypothetical protein
MTSARRSVWPTAVLALAAGCVLLVPSVAHSEWVLDATAALAHDDNLNNALESDNRKADSALTATLRAGIYEQLGASTGLTLNLLAEQAAYLRYTGLTNLGAGASARLRHKFWLGSDAPWAMLSAQALHRNYHYDYRDGWQYDAGVSFGKLLTPRWSVQGSVRYDRFTADHLQAPVLPGISTAAYDVSGWSLGAQAGYSLTPSDVLSAAYTFRNGTVTAVTPPDLEILEYSSAVARDPVFGTSPRMVAYRFPGKTDVFALAWSHALGTNAAVALSYAYRRTRGAGDLGEYYSNLISLSVVYSR